ncbi:MAG: hypothetical protein ABI856_20255 [Nitrospira sp.]
MKRPANPFTIHIYEANYVVKHIAGPRHSTWAHRRPNMAQGLIRARHGLVQSSRVAVFVVARLSYMIARICIGVVRGIRLVYDVPIRLLEFVFITLPLFVIGLCFLLATIAFVWGIGDALYRSLSHLPHP